MLRVLSVASLVLSTALGMAATASHVLSQEIDAVRLINRQLDKLANVRYLGVFQNGACALSGRIITGKPRTINLKGAVQGGLTFGEISLLSSPIPLNLSTRTVGNCGVSEATLQRQFSEGFTKSVTLQNTKMVGGSVGINATVNLGVPGAGMSTGVTATHNWSATETRTQMFSQTHQVSDSLTVRVPPQSQVEVSLVVFEAPAEVPYEARVVFDGDMNPCMLKSGKKLSDHLTKSKRTFIVSGVMSFRAGDHAEFVVSAPRPLQCEGRTDMLDGP